MELQQIINELQNYKKGTYTNIQYKSNLVPIKGYENCSICKVVTTVARLGCKYGNVVKDWVPSETRKSWNHDIFKGILVEHNTQDKQYIKVYTTNNSKQTKVKYFLDGKEVEYSQIESIIKPTSYTSDLKMYLKNIEDILQLGKIKA